MTKNIAKLVKTLTATTNGKGYWSTEKRTVGIEKIEIENIMNVNEEPIDVIDSDSTDTPKTVYLRVYFNRSDWDVKKHGLIYTDTKWLTQLRKGLVEIGVTAAGLNYTEQGMQGSDFVSLCVRKKPKTIAAFIKAFD